MGTVRKQLSFSLGLLTLKLAIVFLSMSSSFSTHAMEMIGFNKVQRKPFTNSPPPPHPLDGKGNAFLSHENGPSPPPPPSPPLPLQETNDVYREFMLQQENAYGLLSKESPPVGKKEKIWDEKAEISNYPPAQAKKKNHDQEFDFWNSYQDQKREKKRPKGVKKCRHHTSNFEQAPETFHTYNLDRKFQKYGNAMDMNPPESIEDELNTFNPDNFFDDPEKTNTQSGVWQEMSDTRKPGNSRKWQKNDEDP